MQKGMANAPAFSLTVAVIVTYHITQVQLPYACVCQQRWYLFSMDNLQSRKLSP